MTLDQVTAKITEVIGHFKEDPGYYLSNEMSTRDQLINPILNVLGWQTSSPKYVRPNQKNELGDIPDYTLFKQGVQVLVIEAKKASIKVQDPKVIEQLVKYCYKMGVKFGLIANGLQWLLFNTFEQNPAERIVWVVDLESTKDGYYTEARQLSQFAYESIDALADKIKQMKVLEHYWAANFGSPSAVVKFISQTIKDKAKREQELDLDMIEAFVSRRFSAWDLASTSRAVAPSLLLVEAQQPPAHPKADRDATERAPKANIRVLFADGTVIFNKRASDTLAQVIEKIGGEKVRALQLIRNGINLVETAKNSTYSQYPIQGGFFVLVHSSTDDKVRTLTEISKRLGLNLKIAVE
ncbi:MAG: type I restriction enzyme HsdR N-terminal domain-containing protein [Bernardetiaceae bacterium]|jgi:predicted type IV restriction endonuclease|nr:type I restriction enzyme HsdR N-terminal domain-containing protein [Bernardetiaceae bacterium]